MRFALCCGLMFFVPILMTAAEDAKPQLVFQDETYELAFEQSNGRESIKEYIPLEETLEEWSSLIAVRKFAGRRDYEPMAGNLIKSLKAQNPLARAAIHTTPDGKRTMVDFVTWDLNQNITEFNVFIYQLGPDGNSVIAQQYAERVYGKDEGLEFLRELKNRRVKLLTEVGQFKFPALQ